MLFNQSLPAPARPSSNTTRDGSDLEYMDNYKYLGVWFDCKLSFQTHIKHLQSKIKSRIGFLHRNKASFTLAAKHTLVKLTILPILDFGDVIYKIASNTLLNIVDAVYHSAIRFDTKASYTTPIPILYLFIYLAPLHSSISTCTFIFCTSTTPVINCYIVITLPPWPIYCLNSLILPHLYSMYIYFLFSFVLLYY